MVGDDFSFEIAGAPLSAALNIALLDHSKIVAWRVDAPIGSKRLVLYWTTAENATPLPGALTGDALQGFVQSWLDGVEYPPKPDIDGSVAKGCRVYNEAWGQIDDQWQACIAVEPHWIMYGK